MDRRTAMAGRAVVGALLRDVRIASGLVQEEVAERLGRPQSHVSKVEQGEVRVGILQLRELLAAMGYNMSAFIDRLERQLSRAQLGGESAAPRS